MWKIKRNNEMDILKKTQENLEMTQINNQMLFDTFSNILNKDKTIQGKIPKTDEEKLQAAYALNLCTVSISQIIEYNDIRFMENEYEAILNNLNLENMPKDEALLRILTQLLDVITFFRIQDGDKKMMEREYKQKIKDAIWSAIPNPNIIVAGGSPVSIAISLASQIGTGYMNYRKEKAEINLDRERKEWELQRSAIEQFHGLRRELFDTAWRLADEYKFPDEYRITERQISQFNNILLDDNYLRRYARLDYIKDNFKAYPPFWYYLGHAANAIYQEKIYFDDTDYKKLAIEHFSRFLQITENNLMREDQLVASCALEKFDLIEDKKEQISLLEKATKASGKALDVQQICAISYLKIDETEKACELLKMLINEDYNANANAQLLSRIYVMQYMNATSSEALHRIKNEYFALSNQYSSDQQLFPFPETETNILKINESFITSQKSYLTDAYRDALITYIEKCEEKYYNICNLKGNITSEMADFISEIKNSVEILVNRTTSDIFLDKIKNSIKNDFKAKLINSDARITNKTRFKEIFKDAYIELAETIIKIIEELDDMNDISTMDSHLQDFIVKNNLFNELNSSLLYNSEKTQRSSIEEIFGKSSIKSLETSNAVEECKKILSNDCYKKSEIIINSDKANYIKRDDPEFDGYLEKKSSVIRKKDINKDSIIAIIDDTSFSDTDYIFTTTYLSIIHGKLLLNRAYYCPYRAIKLSDKGDKLTFKNHKISNEDLNLPVIFKLIKELAKNASIRQNETNNEISAEISTIFANHDKNEEQSSN